MSIGLYMDVHIRQAITDGLRLRGVDVITAQEDGMRRLADPALLDRATALGRVLFTHDDDFLTEAARRQQLGIRFAGIIYSPQLAGSIGQRVNDLEIVAKGVRAWRLGQHGHVHPHVRKRVAMALPHELGAEIRSLYAAVDRDVAAAGPVCEASGRCCRFKEYGHVLYLSNLEAEVLLASAPAYSKPVSSDFCPFQIDNLCTAREPRPLGCRVYFCDPNYQETANQITERYLRQLKQLAQEHGIDWQYAPLHHFLNEAERDTPSPDDRLASPRIALPLTSV